MRSIFILTLLLSISAFASHGSKLAEDAAETLTGSGADPVCVSGREDIKVCYKTAGGGYSITTGVFVKDHDEWALIEGSEGGAVIEQETQVSPRTYLVD